jgi:hypothetical protein
VRDVQRKFRNVVGCPIFGNTNILEKEKHISGRFKMAENS